MLRIFISTLLFSFLGFASLIAEPTIQGQHEIILVDYEGVTWRCKRCGYYNYSESPDWRGDYYCLRCKTRKGDE